MIAASPEPRLRDMVDAIGYIQLDLENVTLESFAADRGNVGRSSDAWTSSQKRAVTCLTK